LGWIPWQRYVLLLSIDGKQAINLGRFMRREAPGHIAERLNLYRGYKAEVVDTKEASDR